MATGRSPIKVPCENEDLPEKENAPDFDEDTLQATADVYKNQGNEAFKKGDFTNAIHFYSEGIKMNCNEKELKAKLYNNRAIAHSKLGNHQDSLRDAEAAIELNPIFLKAIVRGATACVELKRFEESITWCDKGLAIDRNNRILSSLRLQSVKEVGDKSMEEKDPISHDHGSASSATTDVYKNQGNEAFKKGDFINAIHFYTKGIKMNCNEKELKAKLYNNRAIAHFKLGNHQDSLRDAEAAIELNPTFLKAIVRGAIACVELKRFEEAITWCDKGLAIDKNERILLSLGLQSVSEEGDKSIEEKDRISYDHGGASSGDDTKVIDFCNRGGKHGEGNTYDNLGNAHNSLGDLIKAREYHNLHLKIAKEVGDKHGEGNAYGGLGIAYQGLSEFKIAVKYHNLHLKIAKEIGDKHGEGGAYGGLGNAYFSMGDFKKAIEYHNLHLEIAKEVGDKRGKGNAYGNLGNAYLSLGDFKKAREYHSLHLRIAKEVGDKHGEGGAYGCLGNAYFSLGDFIKAIEYHNLHLKIAKEVGDKHGEGNAYGSLGIVHRSLGYFKKAVEYHNLHLKIAQEVGDKLGEGGAYSHLGNAYGSVGDFKKAIEYHNLHLKKAKEVGDKHGEGKAYGNLGNAYFGLGDFKTAIEYHNLYLKIVKEVGDKYGEGKAYNNLGNAHGNLGDIKKAIEYYKLFLKKAQEVGDKHGKGKAYGNLGNVYFGLGDFQKAIEYHNLHLKIAKEIGDKYGEGGAYGNLGIGYEGLGDFKKAIEYHNLHLKIAKEIGEKHGEGNAYGNLGNSYGRLGDFKKAIEYHNLHLKIAKEVGDKRGEGNAYGGLGNAYQGLSEFKIAVKYHNLHLKIAKEVGDKDGKGKAYGSLGNVHRIVGDFEKALEYHNLHLKIAKEVGDRHGEGNVYGCLGNAYFSLSDFKKAIEYYNLYLKVAQEVGDKHGEGNAYGNLGNAYNTVSDFKKAIEYHNLALKIAKEVGDKHGEGCGYASLGNDYFSLGDLKKAIEYHNLHLKIAKEVGDKHGEGGAYGNLGNVYRRLCDFRTAIEYHILHLKIAQEVSDKHGEGVAYGNLGSAYHSLSDFKKAIEYHNLHLKIAKEVGDKHGEGKAYGNLGNVYQTLGDLVKANTSYNVMLKISKEVEDKSMEAIAYYSLGFVSESLGGLPKAVEQYQASINLFNSLRVLLKSKDEWKVNFRNQYQMAYTGLWRALVEQGKIDDALYAAEKGRAQALTDLMESSFCGGTSPYKTGNEDFAVLRYVPSAAVFQAVDKADVNLWVISEGKQVQLRRSKLSGSVSENSGVSQSFESFMLGVYTQLGVRSNVRCENRSLDALREGRSKVDEKSKEANPQPPIQQNECLSTLYDIVMKPVADLVPGDELLVIPDGPLWLAPYAALKDGNYRYMCESFRIRLAPSLTSLTIIADCPDDYHKSSGALLVGDPWVAEVTNSKGEKLLEQLPCAKEEVEMIGKILNITPITGRQATKREVLKRLSSVSLVHFAAHGCMETGQIALTPDPDRISAVPTEEDYILTIGDVLNAQLRAKLVVLSCCHSGRGEIKAEGVVGIARAFMGSGARSVVVSLWAIDDVATLEFMKYFYQHLAEGKPASASLNLAMKSLRESDKFCDIKYWAPFLLIGDDVTLNFTAKEREN